MVGVAEPLPPDEPPLALGSYVADADVPVTHAPLAMVHFVASNGIWPVGVRMNPYATLLILHAPAGIVDACAVIGTASALAAQRPRKKRDNFMWGLSRIEKLSMSVPMIGKGRK